MGGPGPRDARSAFTKRDTLLGLAEPRNAPGDEARAVLNPFGVKDGEKDGVVAQALHEPGRRLDQLYRLGLCGKCASRGIRTKNNIIHR